MTTDDERAQKIAEAKARAEAARAARQGGQPAPSAAPPPAEAPAVEAPPAIEPVTVPDVAAAPAVAATEAAPAGSGGGAGVTAAGTGGSDADERARKIAEARARAEAARAGRAAGAPQADTAPAAASPVAAAQAEAAPAIVAAEAAPPPAAAEAAPAGDERARRIAEAKARAAAARGDGAATPAPPAAPAAAAPPAAATPAAPAAPAARPAAAAPTTAIAPAGDWRGPATAPARVLTARPETRAVMRRELEQAAVRNVMTRRSLVRSSFWAGLGITTAGLALGFVNFFWPRGVQGFGGIVTVPVSQVPQPGAEPIRNVEGKFWLVNLEPGGGVPQQFQSFAPPSQSGGLVALYQKCPHLGCTVPWRPEFVYEGERGWFRCPCHGSTYTKAGIRVFGPAPRPMDMFPLTVNGDGSVAVNTDPAGIIVGSPQNPQRAVLS